MRPGVRNVDLPQLDVPSLRNLSNSTPGIFLYSTGLLQRSSLAYPRGSFHYDSPSIDAALTSNVGSFNDPFSGPTSTPQSPSPAHNLPPPFHTNLITPKMDFTVTQIMSAVAIAQRKLKIAQALERQAATELISAAKLDAFRKVKAAATLEGGKRRRRKAASTGTKKKATKKKARKSTKRKTKK